MGVIGSVVRPWCRCLVLALAVGACSATGPDQPGSWSSEQASLTVGAEGTVLKILAAESCYGAFGEITGAIPSGSFRLAGTLTQLTGAFPGRIVYPATFVGSVAGRQIVIGVEIPSNQTTLGPYTLTKSAPQPWEACRFP